MSTSAMCFRAAIYLSAELTAKRADAASSNQMRKPVKIAVPSKAAPPMKRSTLAGRTHGR